MQIAQKNKKSNILMYFISLCSFIACMTPRYIPTFKIYIGMNISFYTILVILLWLIYSRRIVFYKASESVVFLVWFLFTAISAFRSSSIGDWLYYFVWIVTAVLNLQLFYTLKKEIDYKMVLQVLVLAMQIHLLIGLYEITAHRHLFHTGNYGRYYYGMTPISIFHNPNDYAVFISTICPFAFYLFSISSRKTTKIIYLLTFALSIIMIDFTGSRAAFFSVAAGIAIILFLFFKRSNRNKIWIIFTVILFAIGVLISSRLQEVISDSILSNSINISRRGDANRINLVRNGVYFLKETFGIGVGAGNLKYWLREKSIYYIGRLEYIHNWYLEIMVTFGIPFFILYVVFHCKILARAFKNSISSNSLLNQHTFILISFIMFSIASISSSSNAYSEWIWMYYTLLASYTLFSINVSRNKQDSKGAIGYLR